MKTDLERYIKNMAEIHREALQSKSTDAAGLEQMAMFAIKTAEAFREKELAKERNIFIRRCVEVTSGVIEGSSGYEHWSEWLFDAGCRFVKD